MIFQYFSKIFIPRPEGPPSMTLMDWTLENIKEKTICGDCDFFLLPQCFLPCEREESSFSESRFVTCKFFNPFPHNPDFGQP